LRQIEPLREVAFGPNAEFILISKLPAHWGEADAVPPKAGFDPLEFRPNHSR